MANKYVATCYFKDLEDGNYVYRAGDSFPRHDYTPTDERIAELSGTNNRRGIALIKKVTPKKKKTTAVNENAD